MTILLLLGVSFIAAAILAFVGDRKYAPEINIACSLVTFAVSIALAIQVYNHGSFIAGGKFFFIDAFNVYLVVLTSFVSMTTAIFSRRYMRLEMEHATLSTVLLVSLYRTPTAIEAAWKYFILCGVWIALALFGTVLLYFAAE